MIKLTQSNPNKVLTSLQTIRWFNTEFDDNVLQNFESTFPSLENVFILNKDKDTQHKLLKLLIKSGSNVKNIMMPEFKFGEQGESTELDNFFSTVGIGTNETIVVATKADGKWEKGSRFNFWKD